MNPNILEILLYFPTLLLIIFILVVPFFIHNKTKVVIHNKIAKILFSVTICIIFSGILTFIFTYWSIELSNNILLKNLGYNESGMDEFEYYQNVKHEYLKKAKEIRERKIGIGWNLTAGFNIVFLIILFDIIMNIILYIINNIE